MPAPEFKPSSTPTPPAADHADHWQCDELLVDVAHDGDNIRLMFSGRSLPLMHVESLVGARYADKSENAFTVQGDAAKLMLAGQRERDCTRSQRASAWSDAAARGVVFRAVGSEPGWWIEVGSGDDPPMHAVLDYGDHTIDVAHAHGINSTPGYGGRTSDGLDVVLRTKRETCHDGMSGEAFESSAELKVGDKTYRGCGAYLQAG